MILVTGCAGFIGSHLTERLLSEGNQVVGIDRFSDYYDRPMKEKNISGFSDNPKFRFAEGDITKIDLKDLLSGVEIVFHQAAQPGVRASWGESFDIYTRDNIIATQKLLEACKDLNLQKFVYASSSSVYGDVRTMPLKEDMTPRPVSPYGVSKLAGENLCYLYHKSFGVPTISLRYFTVYGPRQRPDMAFHKFIKAILNGEEIRLFGDGEQTRDFTYISDIVEANILAMKSDVSGVIFNIGGGTRISVTETISMIEELTEKEMKISREKSQRGDMKHTTADITKASEIGYSPRIRLRDGLRTEIEWLKSLI